MKTFYFLNFLSFLEMIYSQYLLSVDSFFQKKETIMELNGEVTNNLGIVFGIWSKYNPLNKISYGGIVGLSDSNCFHYLNFIQESSGYLELILYDCLNSESQTIEKTIAYNTADGLSHIHKLNIDPLRFENVWYLFELLYLPSAQKLELIIVEEEQFILHELLNDKIIKTKNLILSIGSGLIVQNSNIESIEVGSKFSYFPGQLKLLKVSQEIVTSLDPQILGKGIYVLFFDSISEYYCKQNTQHQLLDHDITQMDIMTFTSQNININSFTFYGWYKIIEIHQNDEQFTYQFLKIMPNFENEQLSNPNLTPFQLSYKISSNNYKIIISTYSYKFPSVTLDFNNNNNAFLLTQEFEILNKITLWHNLQVKLVDEQIFISIKFYDSSDIHEYNAQFNVKQFHNVQFKLLYGNLQKSPLNYLDIQTRNQIFYNCQQQIEQENCHYTCQNCDGPTKRDCLSCSQESSRIYIQEFKVCICPYDYYDDQINQNCKSYSDLQFIINQIQIENGCKFGYFEFDDSCYACPSIISNQLTTCLECIQNVKGWQQNPYCQTTVYINPNGNTAKTISDEDYIYYVFDGLESQMCRYCNQQFLQNIDSIYQDFNLLIQSFKSFCQLSKSYFYGTFDFNICYECNILGCITCSIGIKDFQCTICEKPWILVNGICTFNSYSEKNNECLTPYYRNSIGECKLCNLQNCKYCFEYNKNDLSKCTLYANFDKFDQDEYLAIGCALCEDNFNFDFNIGKCIYKQPSLPNCIRSFIDLQNQEICTLSSTDFSIAPEIINCDKFISNCLQCILTPQSSIKCIICQSGFTSTLNLGSCYPNQFEDAKIVIEGSKEIVDGWVQRVQSFMMKFLPKQYYYQRPYNDQTVIQFQIECKEGYKQNDQQVCIKYCTSDCLKCALSINSDNFDCIKCPQNYYEQPIRSETDGQCIECPELCDVCERRSETEIYQLNPNFKINGINRKYTNKCTRKVSDPNVIIDPYFFIAKYCYTINCIQEFKLELSSQDNYIDIDSKVNIQYSNQIGLSNLQIKIDQKKDDESYKDFIQTSLLKSEIFSLRFLKLKLNLYENNFKTFIVSGFDFIEINDAHFQFKNQDHFQFENKNQQVNILLNNIVIQQSSISNVNPILNSDIFGDITLKNILIIDSNLKNSSLFSFQQKQQQGVFKIEKMILKQCNFTNTQFLQIFNNKIKIQIDQLVIDSCQFVNSSFITFLNNLIYVGEFEVNTINFTSNNLYQSYFLNSTYNFQIWIINFNFQQNLIEMSTIIKFSSNITLLKTQLNNNNFIDSYFMAAIQIDFQNKLVCLIENYQVYENDLTNSNLLNIESTLSNQNIYVQLISFDISQNQRGVNQQQQINLFNIHCFQLDIENIQIINSNNLRIFYLFEIQKFYASNIVYENLEIDYKVSFSLNCSEYTYIQNQLFLINGFNIIIIQNIKVHQQSSIDRSLIEISSKGNSLTNQKFFLQLIDTQFIGNLLLKQFQSSISSLITIYSEYESHIKLENIVLQNNFLHYQIDDPSESSTSLIQILSIGGLIEINNFICQSNAVTNSSNSFISLKSEIIQLTNYSISKHNVIPFELWMSYYDFSIDIDEYDQDQINLIIQQIFKIKSKGGGGLISASSFSCFNCSFEDIIGFKSSVFEIKTQGDGNISFINLTIKSLEYDLSQIVDSTGCITIYSSNSLLNLQIYNAVFQNIFNRMAPSIFTIIPSLQKNQVRIEDIQIINTISLKNPIINLQFSSYDINLNTVIIRNIKISQYEDIWIKYFDKTGMISQSEIQDLTGTSNALIQLSNCKVVIQNILIQGLYACPLIKLINVQYLFISYFQAIEIQTFYGFSLLEIKLELPIKQTIYFEFVYIQHFSGYEIYYDSIFYNPKMNYMISGCGQVENMQQNPQIYYFYDIINLMQILQPSSLIFIETNSNHTVLYLESILFQENYCYLCINGLFYLKMENYSTIIIRDLMCNLNTMQLYGCINIQGNEEKNQQIQIWNSNFFYNYGSEGVAIQSGSISILINKCKIIQNLGNIGGGLFLKMNQRTFLIKESIITNNFANFGAGIYLEGELNINEENFIQSFFEYNNINQDQQLVEFPTHLSLLINSIEMQSEEIKINNITLKSLLVKPYNTIEQGVSKISQYLMIPSQQVVKDYEIFIPTQQISFNIFNDLQIAVKNSRNEQMFITYQIVCQVSQINLDFNQDFQLNESQIIATLYLDQNSFTFDLGSISFHYNPYQEENEYLQILISCSTLESTEYLYYLIKARTYKCQLGEFYADEGCQICESIYGFYSVTYNATKCSIFDKIKFANITSNSIQLFEGYWRPNLYSDYTEFCFKNEKFCKGGWMVGNELCSIGRIGGLCEECDTHNIRGEGQFFKNQSDAECFGCSINTITPFILTSLWAIITILITLRSIEKSNQLFFTCKLNFKLNIAKILFKLGQDMESIFIKMVINYLWIFSVIFTFNINFSISLSLIESTSNASQFMAFNLDCFISNTFENELIYLRIIATFLLILIQFIIIQLGYNLYTLLTKGRFQRSIISNTLLYLYVSNYSSLIKQFCSIVSKRIISNIQYVQGDVSLIYGTQNHYQWMYVFAIPGLTIFGLLIPLFFFFLLLNKKGKLAIIKVRRHICYLFNEYKQESFFWEQIKFLKKTSIILVLTFFESNILFKASLLGLCLLVYQLLAGKQQPYIISSLNNLDLQTGQICSIAIFIATAKYVNEQEAENVSSQILQIVIIILFIKLCSLFIFDIFRGYAKKYKVQLFTLIHNIIKMIKPNSQQAKYINNVITQLKLKEIRLRSNYQILKTASQEQIKRQKCNNQAIVNQNLPSLNRYKKYDSATNQFLLTIEQ